MEKKMLDIGYSLTGKVRWGVVILSTLLAFWWFDYKTAVFILVATVLAHELPTLAMGVYIFIKMRKDKDGNKFDGLD